MMEQGWQVGAVPRTCDQRAELVERELRLEEALLAQDKGIEFGAGDGLGGVEGICGEVRRQQESRDAVEWKWCIDPAQDVERGRDQRCASQWDAERELVGSGVRGRSDVIEFGREDVAEDTVDLGASGFDRGDDDGDAGGGLLGEAVAQPVGTSGELRRLVGGADKGKAGRRPDGSNSSSSAPAAWMASSRAICAGVFESKPTRRYPGPGAICCAAAAARRASGSWASVRYCARAQRRSNSATQRAKARVSELPGRMEALAVAVVMQQLPSARGGLGEGVRRPQADGGGVGGDDCAPESMLLRGAEQQAGHVAVQQQAVPQAERPLIPRKDPRRLPDCQAKRVLAEVVGAAESAGGALIGGEYGPVARRAWSISEGSARGKGIRLLYALGRRKKVRVAGGRYL